MIYSGVVLHGAMLRPFGRNSKNIMYTRISVSLLLTFCCTALGGTSLQARSR